LLWKFWLSVASVYLQDTHFSQRCNYMKMETAFFDEKGIKFEVVPHAEIKEAGVEGAAQVLNCPRCYIVTTILFEADGKTIGVATGGGAQPDVAMIRSATGAGKVTPIPPDRAEEITGVPKLFISPLSLWKKFDVIWDERLLDYPYIVFAEPGGGESIRVDTRDLERAGVKSALLTPDQTGTDRSSAFDILLQRGFIDRVTDEDMARKIMADPSVRGYIGFDPTASSLHVGSLVPIMSLAHIQRCGINPIAIVGGGTALVGDPSGKTEMRQMLTRKQIEDNMKGIIKQLQKYIRFGDGKALLLNNADWLTGISYIDFLREIGVHFSVNRMLRAECFASRLEKGLSFIEFNYMLMQAYDFAYLAQEYNCLVQLGGSDQWGNIIAGKDLAHRTKGTTLFGKEITRGDRTVGITFPLLKKASGTKFGKTEGGNVWLGSDRTSIYDFFQFWRNSDDMDVRRLMGLFTFIAVPEVRRLTAGKSGEELNLSKEITAFAATSLAHGTRPALEAAETAKSRFGGYSDDFVKEIISLGLAPEKDAEDFLSGNIRSAPEEGSGGKSTSGLPTLEIESARLSAGEVLLIHVLRELGMVSSNGEAKRMIKQKAVKLESETVADPGTKLPEIGSGGEIRISMGKKKHGVVKVI